MEQVLITSGRMNHGIDPHLHAWGWEIALYLYLGGLVAGILFFATFYYIRGKADLYPTAVKLAPFFTPLFLAIGLGALFVYHCRHFTQAPQFLRLFLSGSFSQLYT